jgi:hypothetical protein
MYLTSVKCDASLCCEEVANTHRCDKAEIMNWQSVKIVLHSCRGCKKLLFLQDACRIIVTLGSGDTAPPSNVIVDRGRTAPATAIQSERCVTRRFFALKNLRHDRPFNYPCINHPQPERPHINKTGIVLIRGA